MSVRDAIQDSDLSTSEQVSGGIPYPACVTPAVAATVGSTAIPYLPAPGYSNTDLSLAKDIKWTRSMDLSGRCGGQINHEYFPA